MKIQKNNLMLFFLFIFPILYYNFYNIVYLNKVIAKVMFFALISGTLLYIFPGLLKISRKSKYEVPFRLLLLVVILSMVNSFIFWDQDIVLSFRATAPYLGFIYFFLLIKSNPEKDDLEKIVMFFGFLYVILWAYGMLKAPQVVFGVDDDSLVNDSRGIFRLSLAGKGFLVLSFFLALNKYVQLRNLKWLICFVFLYAIIVLQVARQMILFTFLISLIYMLRNSKLLWLFLPVSIILIFIGGVGVDINSDSVIGRLIYISTRQLQDHNSGEENVRVLEYGYFLTSYSKNLYTDLFGNGVPHFESLFGHRELNLKDQFAYFVSDVGYAEVFVRFGLAGLAIYILIFLRATFQKVNVDTTYCKMFIIYIACVSVTSSWIFNDCIPICISLYLLEKDNLMRKSLLS